MEYTGRFDDPSQRRQPGVDTMRALKISQMLYGDMISRREIDLDLYRIMDHRRTIMFIIMRDHLEQPL